MFQTMTPQNTVGCVTRYAPCVFYASAKRVFLGYAKIPKRLPYELFR